MKQAVILALVLTAFLAVAEQFAGMRFAAALGFAATTVIAATNAVTFLWLYYARATPLALGMSLTWFGQASISIWWYVGGSPGNGEWLDHLDSAFLFLIMSVYIVGGALHIVVMQRSMELGRAAILLPVAAAFAVALGTHAYL